MDDMSAVENHIRSLRNLKGLTIGQLAAELGVDESTVARWETGSRAVPDEMKVRLARFFSLPVHSIFAFDSGSLACSLAIDALATQINERVS